MNNPNEDTREQALRIDLMTIQIERLRQEIKMENRKFAVQQLPPRLALASPSAGCCFIANAATAQSPLPPAPAPAAQYCRC